MSLRFSCPHGHSWELSAATPGQETALPVACPTCGAAAERLFTSTAQAATPTPGPAIPGYQLLAEVGRGTVGTVYKARQLGHNRVVAVKVLREDLLTGSHTLARFCKEVETLAGLPHPNIVPLFA